MKPSPVGLVILGGGLFWISAVALWWTRGIAETSAIMLGILLAIGGILVIAAGMIDPKEPRE
jgi:hypothetical protein